MTVIDATERLDRLEKVLEDLRTENQHIPVLVEGKRDVAALRALGITGEIIMVNEGKTIIALCEEIASKHEEVILLLDWDRKGKELTERFKRNLTTVGVRVIDGIRARIFSLVAKETKEVEALDSFVERLRIAVDERRIRPYPGQ